MRPSMRRWLKRILIPLAILIALPVGFYFYAQWQGERELQSALAELDASGEAWRWEEVLAARPPVKDGNDIRDLVFSACGLMPRSFGRNYSMREDPRLEWPPVAFPAEKWTAFNEQMLGV